MVIDNIVSLVGNNTCFYGKCYYCRETEPACAEGDVMEGSVTLWLPDVWPLQKHRHPWGRTYREGKLARYSNYLSFTGSLPSPFFTFDSNECTGTHRYLYQRFSAVSA